MKKVITYGTYDLFHNGHYNMLKRAKEYGDYLIVGVTGENYDVGRGKLSVKDSLATRIENVQKTGLADEIIVEEYLGQKIGDIVRYGVDVLVIGDDWKGKFDHLSRYCDVVYLERTKGISSTQLREERFAKRIIGIVTDFPDDNRLLSEARAINEFELRYVYTENKKAASVFPEEYPDCTVVDSYDSLLDASDIIYVHSIPPHNTEYIRKALEHGKHVIYDPPATLSRVEMEELYALAKKMHVVLISNIKMVHIHVFNQMLWMTQGGLIGDIVSFNSSISRIDYNMGNIFYNLLTIALCPMIKVLGTNYLEKDIMIKTDENGVQFASLSFLYPNTRATINVGNRTRVRNRLEIIGTEGTVHQDGNWWRGSYFEIDKPENDAQELYNTNYSGNGFKYLLRAIETMITNDRLESMGLFEDESLAIVEILEAVREIETAGTR